MKAKRITWTIEAAAREFCCSRTKLTARVADTGAKPDSDGKFTTKQICEALFGSAHQSRLREANARAELAEARTAILHKKWLPADMVDDAWQAIVATIRQRLLDVPSAFSGSNAVCIRKEISTALEDLSKVELESFSDTEIEKKDTDEDEQ